MAQLGSFSSAVRQAIRAGAHAMAVRESLRVEIEERHVAPADVYGVLLEMHRSADGEREEDGLSDAMIFLTDCNPAPSPHGSCDGSGLAHRVYASVG